MENWLIDHWFITCVLLMFTLLSNVVLTNQDTRSNFFNATVYAKAIRELKSRRSVLGASFVILAYLTGILIAGVF